MNDLEYCIENFHKPRLGKLAEFLLTESEYRYDFIAPPVFETYMIQIMLPEELILSINYFPIEITDDTPYLFLQFHCLLMELDDEASPELFQYMSQANNETELSSYHIDGNQLYLKSVLIDDPETELDVARIGFLLRVFHNNLFDHLDGFRSAKGG